MINRVIKDMIMTLYILIVPMWIMELLGIDAYLVAESEK
jgi:hypothetical protein